MLKVKLKPVAFPPVTLIVHAALKGPAGLLSVHVIWHVPGATAETVAVFPVGSTDVSVTTTATAGLFVVQAAIAPAASAPGAPAPSTGAACKTAV